MSVEVPKADDLNVIYYPECVAVPQCGGCCGHDMLECAPLEERVKEIEVSEVVIIRNYGILCEIAIILFYEVH